MTYPNAEQIKAKILSVGFHQVGIATVDDLNTEAIFHLETWLNLGYHGDLTWMSNPKRQDIRACFPEVQSVICVVLNYYTPFEHPEGAEYAKISRYAWGRDYHKVLSKKLKQISSWLSSQGEDIKTRYYVDTGPILEKVWSQQAGLGWIAKNGNLITRNYGSWVFLGEILVNIPLEADQPHTQHCGSCTRCLEACPTQAITQPFVVDANLCLAYHTIENRAPELPTTIAENLQGWVAGCDICQDVCPWNQRFAKVTDCEDFFPYPENIAPKLTELAEITETEWDDRFRSSSLRRIKPDMLRRNAKANLKQ
ncbi:MAG: tRNA epoxyqueuosine(34) reductase QueG [Gloeocapsa sp. DLM2.Bin57]|nr:MAG: tRNA epoxyqueuosine(34) reductase QueG [Gloeocapsa sp. DLM2.Bin57]